MTVVAIGLQVHPSIINYEWIIIEYRQIFHFILSITFYFVTLGYSYLNYYLLYYYFIILYIILFIIFLFIISLYLFLFYYVIIDPEINKKNIE